jgi:hypothetical protein
MGVKEKMDGVEKNDPLFEQYLYFVVLSLIVVEIYKTAQCLLSDGWQTITTAR